MADQGVVLRCQPVLLAEAGVDVVVVDPVEQEVDIAAAADAVEARDLHDILDATEVAGPVSRVQEDWWVWKMVTGQYTRKVRTGLSLKGLFCLFFLAWQVGYAGSGKAPHTAERRSYRF